MGVTGPDLTAAVGLDWLLLLCPEIPFAFVRSALILVWIHDPGIPSPNPNNKKVKKNRIKASQFSVIRWERTVPCSRANSMCFFFENQKVQE